MNQQPTMERMDSTIHEFMGGVFYAYKGNSSYKKAFKSYLHCAETIEKNKWEGYRPEIAWGQGCGKYHASWDALMPVVEKISTLANITIKPGICTIEHFFMNKKRLAKTMGISTQDVPPISECNELGFIGNVHKAVYDFIVWYNQNKNI